MSGEHVCAVPGASGCPREGSEEVRWQTRARTGAVERKLMTLATLPPVEVERWAHGVVVNLVRDVTDEVPCMLLAS